MKQLKTLIRLQQRELDRLRQRMVKLEAQRDGYIDQIEALTQLLQREFEAAGEMLEMQSFFGDFSGSIKKQQQQIAAKVLKVEKSIQELAIQIQNQFAEVKKYEIAYDNYLLELAQEAKRLEQMEMDEIGIRGVIYGES